MTVSIITATYNSAATVRDTLDSIRSQDFSGIEHIIIDGASSDNTLGIIAQYPHVAKVVSEKDKGIYDAMNKGIALATGDIIGILNSDDVYYGTHVISTLMKAFENTEIDAAYGDLQYVRQDDLNRVTRRWQSGEFSKKKFYFGWMPPHPTFFVRKKIYEEIGGFNLSLRSAADYEFMLRTLLKYDYRPCYIPETLVKMRTGGISNATLRHRLRANAEDRQAWKINDIDPYIFTIPLKPIRKIVQFFNR